MNRSKPEDLLAANHEKKSVETKENLWNQIH